ncbi:isochorismatase family protein [Pediococcus parvulus]|jgi:nicotinamidase-related amidase|uniref:isochorismatase family protein n=1 Tax=Pediococcus parvulus TaxID=54062 RepID=UPI00070D5EF2|nr:isochorismatase family protein [Pediococcus parvulus]MDN5576091.1 isochorismatase family protein [Pediococcus sp.]MCT3028049.1 isochorismatase family protein [Pediococcus parvulus]MCT3035679.1 isochorismatase family protein [Pediococcus parvulus]GEL90584.1 amidase [Pediococcus parvulus]GHC15123.1 amidase [Pediococcus parvulus]
MADVLIVIDMQNALHKMANFDAVVAGINKRIAVYRQEKKAIFFVQTTDDEIPSDTEAFELTDKLDFKSQKDEFIVKTTPDSFYHTNLEAYLKTYNTHSVEICGGQTEYCVDTTIRVARHLNYEVEVTRGLTTTFDSDLLNAQTIIKHHESIWDGSFATMLPSN